MAGFFSKLFGGNKSEKDVKRIEPLVAQINKFFTEYQSLNNDALRNKTIEFRERIEHYLKATDEEINAKNKQAEELSFNDLNGKDTIYQEVDILKKDRDKKIEEVLKEILPEAFAVVKETARRFKENQELIATATTLDRELSVKKDYVKTFFEKHLPPFFQLGGNATIGKGIMRTATKPVTVHPETAKA